MDSPEIEALFNKRSNADQARANAEILSRRQERQRAKKEKQKRKQEIIKNAIITITLVATLSSAVALTSHITSKIIDNNNAIVSIEQEDKEIDERIEHYTKLMNMYSDPENSIETYLGRININGKNEANVDYTYKNVDNLQKHLLNAAKISETEVRCVIISAFNIINEPYLNEVLNMTLKGIQGKQDETSVYQIPANTQEFLESLGYENWEEYRMNERNNIKEAEAIANHIGGRHN